MCCTYVLSTSITVLCIKGLKAVAAMWPSIFHNVALAAKSGLTFVATEVLHVPVPAFSLSAFIGEDYLHDRDITFKSTYNTISKADCYTQEDIELIILAVVTFGF